MKIANIVTTQKINVSNYFNIVESMDDIIHGIPTLLVGFDYTNKHYPYFDIMDREVEPNLYWIFKKTEKRDNFETGLKWFIDKVIDDLTKEIPYVFVDLMQYKTKSLWKITRKLLSIEKKYSFIYKDMVYIYGDKIVFGIDFKLINFIGLKSDKILNKIISKSIVFFSFDEILIEDERIIKELGNKIRYLPYLQSIINE